jgi:hypothetical protein
MGANLEIVAIERNASPSMSRRLIASRRLHSRHEAGPHERGRVDITAIKQPRQGRLWVELTRSPSRPAATGICAFLPLPGPVASGMPARGRFYLFAAPPKNAPETAADLK